MWFTKRFHFSCTKYKFMSTHLHKYCCVIDCLFMEICLPPVPITASCLPVKSVVYHPINTLFYALYCNCKSQCILAFNNVLCVNKNLLVKNPFQNVWVHFFFFTIHYMDSLDPKFQVPSCHSKFAWKLDNCAKISKSKTGTKTLK